MVCVGSGSSISEDDGSEADVSDGVFEFRCSASANARDGNAVSVRMRNRNRGFMRKFGVRWLATALRVGEACLAWWA